MRGMNEDDLMTLCALSGCDYLPSVHGMGLKKAYRMVSRHKEASAMAANPAIIWVSRPPLPVGKLLLGYPPSNRKQPSNLPYGIVSEH